MILMSRAKSSLQPVILKQRILLLLCIAVTMTNLFAATGKKVEESSPAAAFVNPQNTPISGGMQLQSAQGPRSLSDFQGKVVVMFFGYTHCPDVCPRDLGIMAEAFTGLNEKQMPRTQGVFVSLDPERDDAKTLAEFTRYFNPNFVGLTGSTTQIKQLAERFGIHYKKVPLKGSRQEYSLEHTASIYVLDTQGRLSFVLPNGISPLGLQQAIQFLLEEQPS